jgi:hypothetical protein
VQQPLWRPLPEPRGELHAVVDGIAVSIMGAAGGEEEETA